MAPPSDASETNGGSLSHSPRAGTTKASAPSTTSAASTGDASGGASKSSRAPDSAALGLTSGANSFGC
ncbi:unnamed protein product [Phytophthora fragariaefolia]|uniref:Unnamed protein product n=1 Tax=Phytophthora fragariaefolia TaxID=1490495 RepID=A0A9W7CM83_9STRA|nr:unnamed protein product [Phytophthora fragariaefolia]